MELTWNLDNLYTSFDSKELRKDMEQVNDYIETINKLNSDKWTNDISSFSEIEKFIRLNNEYKKLYSKIYSYAYLCMNADFQNIEAINMLDDIEGKDSELTEAFVRFSRWLKQVKDLDQIIEVSPYLLEHRFYLNELFLNAKYLLSEKEEFVISKMQNTGSKAWEKLYMELVGTTTVEVTINNRVKHLTLSELRNMAYEKDTVLRKVAYNKEADLCKSLSHICANCINGISGEAHTIYEMRGYKSTLEKVVLNSRMDFDTLNAMMSAVKEYLPVFHKYFMKKSELLGYKTKLPFYDIYAPIGDSQMKVSYSEAKNLIVSSFKCFSDHLASFADKVFDEKWIDAEPRKGKGNFGLSVDLFSIQESRIITNFNDNFVDISILAHEIGHAYHSSKLYNQTMLNTEYPAPIAETASIFCEMIVNNELLNILESKEALTILERSISDAAYYIVDFYARYLFENELYERRKLGFLSVDELGELMNNCMLKAYGDSVDLETIHPYMWMNKAGYFMTGMEYLNFPYTFGVLFSKGLYAQCLEKGEAFVNEYDQFLSETSRNNIVDIAEILGINVRSNDFWRSSLKLIERDIEKLNNFK